MARYNVIVESISVGRNSVVYLKTLIIAIVLFEGISIPTTFVDYNSQYFPIFRFSLSVDDL